MEALQEAIDKAGQVVKDLNDPPKPLMDAILRTDDRKRVTHHLGQGGTSRFRVEFVRCTYLAPCSLPPMVLDLLDSPLENAQELLSFLLF